MAKHLVIYTLAHQPHRLKLPAQPIPPGAAAEDIARCLFDQRMDQFYFGRAAGKCYHPAIAAFTEFLGAGGKLCFGISETLLDQITRWDRSLLEALTGFVRHPNCELIVVEPEHSMIFYLDIRRFVEGLGRYRQRLEREFGVVAQVADTTEMFMSNDLYFALARAGMRGGFMDGRSWVLDWRSPTHLYHHQLPTAILARHTDLSDDVGYRFSNRSWHGWPLLASDWAEWIAQADGDFVFVGWDFETFGEHQWRDSGIFDFIAALPGELKRCGVECLGASEVMDRYADRSFDLPLPAFPSTWAGDGGVGFFLGNPIQQALFQLMHHAYNKAVLTDDPALVDLAVKLTQSDVLHLTQWFGRSGDEAQVSAYFTPREWWALGPDRIVWEAQQVFKNFIAACDPAAAAAVRRSALELPSDLKNREDGADPRGVARERGAKETHHKSKAQ